MRMYTVLQRRSSGDSGANADSDIVLVKEGFCWPGLLFGPAWALANRVWAVAAVLVALVAGILMLPGLIGAGETLGGLVLLALAARLGFEGNDLRQWSLQLSGFEITGVVGGRNLADAERRLFAELGPMFYG